LNRVVALEMILAGSHADGVSASRFLREAEAISRLKHPHVVQVYDYGTYEWKPFLSLDFLRSV
jgi:serine/threonine protein kinase